MFWSRSRLVASGLVGAGVIGAVALGFAAPHLGGNLLPGGARHDALATAAPADAGPILVAEKQKDAKGNAPSPRADGGRGVHVEAPATDVNVDKQSGKLRVKAPHTDVNVDPDKGQVRVRAPYVNLDIRW